ncbi:MAG: response regulator [Nitrospirota bacterium]
MLVVDDERQVRDLVGEILNAQGYTVLSASDGRDALRVCACHESPIHLLLTEVLMPDMSGFQLAERVIALRPQTGVLFMCGDTGDVPLAETRLKTGMSFVRKPFSLDALADKVGDALVEDPAALPKTAAPTPVTQPVARL